MAKYNVRVNLKLFKIYQITIYDLMLAFQGKFTNEFSNRIYQENASITFCCAIEEFPPPPSFRIRAIVGLYH